ncbi:hypothetical protein ACHAQJ_006594 [Trichoderma viride]
MAARPATRELRSSSLTAKAYAKRVAHDSIWVTYFIHNGDKFVYRRLAFAPAHRNATESPAGEMRSPSSIALIPRECWKPMKPVWLFWNTHWLMPNEETCTQP